ncbi:MAG: hypothetical protein HY064_07085 [Bacteroidetes bacterium]|nr:hypothetical protein [Bacteroidota bacterium]
MKNLIAFLFLLPVFNANAQVTDNGKLLFDAGIGLGIEHYQFTDLRTNAANPRDTSGSVQVPVTFEYGIKKWFGAGMVMNYAHYINNDSTTDKANGIDLIPSVFFHIPWGLQKLDLLAHFGYGYSHFAYRTFTINNPKYLAGGGVFTWGIKLRWLFSTDGHVGMQFWYSHAQYKYPNGTLSDDTGQNSYHLKLDGPGNNFGLGFFLRF